MHIIQIQLIKNNSIIHEFNQNLLFHPFKANAELLKHFGKIKHDNKTRLIKVSIENGN